MTEDQAKTKWCPFVRFGIDSLSGQLTNRRTDHAKAQNVNCIGSQCMAWRWIMTPDDAMETDGVGRMGGGTPTGYCGLAGKP